MYNFQESDDKTCWIYELQVPKFMDTDSLNVDVQPTYVRSDIKGKITQLSWPDEVLCDRATLQRSTTTGYLVVTAPKANIDDILARKMRLKKTKEDLEKKDKLRKLKDQTEEAKEKLNAAMDGTTREYLEVGGEERKIEEPAREKFDADFDEDEVPPLE